MHIPLGVALTHFIAETEIPTVAHHHDFYWERQRFRSAAVMDFMRAAFPPVHPKIYHTVINSIAGEEMARRTGESYVVIPNILDFKELPEGVDDFNRDFRLETGIPEDSVVFLQPTRIVSRKGIETSIELVRRLGIPNSCLVISHDAGDEGFEYQKRVLDFAQFMGVDLRIVSGRVGEERGRDNEGRKIYSLWDVYPHCDFVTYPSIYEGYGNAFVEAIYFKKPIIVNRYAIFEADIEPKGFDVVAFSEYIRDDTLSEIRALLRDERRISEMAENNNMLGWRYLSYEMLEEKLESILMEIYGSS